AEVLELADAEALVALTRRARLLVVGAARAAGHGIRGRRVRVAELEAVAEDAVVAVRVARAGAAAGDDRRARLGGREPDLVGRTSHRRLGADQGVDVAREDAERLRGTVVALDHVEEAAVRAERHRRGGLARERRAVRMPVDPAGA